MLNVVIGFRIWECEKVVEIHSVGQTQGRIQGGGGVLGQDLPTTPFGGPPNLIKKKKKGQNVVRLCAKMLRFGT